MKKEIGKIINFFSRINVAVVDLTGDLAIGSQITIEGSTTSFEQQVTSMQIEQQSIESAQAGQLVAIKVDSRVRNGDNVYMATPD